MQAQQTISEYLSNKAKRETDTTFRIMPNGKSGYVVNGKIVPVPQFNKMYPLATRLQKRKGYIVGNQIVNEFI